MIRSGCAAASNSATSPPTSPPGLNQVAIFFSILQRKAIKPADFDDFDSLADGVLGFQDRYNSTAEPFKWTWTTKDLTDYPKRLDAHDQTKILTAT